MSKSIHSRRQERLCTALKAARKKAGLTQNQLADRLGMYRSFVSKYEKGERRLDVLEFLAVARAVGIEPAALLMDLEGDPEKRAGPN